MIEGVTSFHQGCKKNDRRQTDKNVDLVDEQHYFINFFIFDLASTWRCGKAVILPHLPGMIFFTLSQHISNVTFYSSYEAVYKYVSLFYVTFNFILLFSFFIFYTYICSGSKINICFIWGHFFVHNIVVSTFLFFFIILFFCVCIDSKFNFCSIGHLSSCNYFSVIFFKLFIIEKLVSFVFVVFNLDFWIIYDCSN